MPNINIDDAYILNETGAQVDKVTGLFTKDEDTTSGEKSFAQLNIGTAGSNRNLLDNGWFRVNQRSATSGSGTTASYIADRWTVTYGNGGVTWSRTDDTITIASTNGASHGDIAQKMEKSLFDYLVGKIVTVSVMLENYSIVSKAITFNSGSAPTIGTDTDGNSIVFRAYQSSTFQDVQIWKYNKPGTFRAVKLELGSVSTLANDAPPKYEQALLDCEHRCVVYDLPTNTLLCRGIATSTTNIAGVIDLPRDMAEDKTPTVSITGSLTTPAGNTITAVSAATYARKNKLRVNFTGTGFTGGTVYDIFTGTSTPKITISADL